ncbi:thioredoxin-like protein [Glomus cerebriforme]|uniref:Thioredoxin-like protein n=1 Tax=Glomus cerebriforme TaxID=658196 RepID=A0A397TG53_9GLOM|nr:thioredoxin-like protein [Glomus cerebriforme]
MSNENKKTVHIDIVSDVICPWCYVGKRRLGEAIKQSRELYPNFSFEIEWHPYLLDPSLTKEAQSKKERLLKKFGESTFNSNAAILIELGKEIGINFDHDGVVAQTYDAHRLIKYAKSQGKQEEMVEILFHNYHEEGKNPADYDVLSEAAASIGLDKEKVLQFLKSDERMQQVKDEISQALNKGIAGVPYYTINNKIEVSGGQEPKVWLEAFEKISKE